MTKRVNLKSEKAPEINNPFMTAEIITVANKGRWIQ
jgi:hypothetical protein